jgi:hypothetical protein
MTTGSEQATTRLREALADALRNAMADDPAGYLDRGDTADHLADAVLGALAATAVAAREAELRAEIAAMKGDLFGGLRRGSEVWVQRAAVLALLEAR